MDLIDLFRGFFFVGIGFLIGALMNRHRSQPPPIRIAGKNVFLLGTLVRTIQDAGGGDWSDRAREHVKWGARGVITDHSDAHGLCYLVHHKDGTEAWYDPTELERID